MNTLVAVSDARDADWAVHEPRPSGGRTAFFAPSFEAQRALAEHGLSCESHERLAWELPKHTIFDRARRLAREWFELPALQDDAALAAVREYAGYPLLHMHWSLLLLSMKEVLESHAFASAVLDAVRPHRVVCSRRDNPFTRYWLEALTGDRGLEAEALACLCRERGIPLEERERPAPPPEAPPRAALGERIKYPLRRLKWACLSRLRPGPWERGFHFSAVKGGPRVLVYTWGGYYLQQVAQVIRELAGSGARVGVCLIGGQYTARDREVISRLGAVAFKKNDWPLSGEEALQERWRGRGRAAMESVRRSADLAQAWTWEHGCFLPGLGELALERELIKSLPETVRDLARAELVLDAFEPDVVMSHFAQHPLGMADVLAARRRGVPTLNCGHGNPSDMAAVRTVFGTRHCATVGQRFKNALETVFDPPEDTLRAVGDSRLEAGPQGIEDASALKTRLGLDPARPVCVFCDMTGWTTKTTIWRHATADAARQALALLEAVPGLQMIYRVHHGAQYGPLRRHLEAAGAGRLVFQESFAMPLIEVLAAAEVVVSHNCSAITESLTRGQRVVFLCTHGDRLRNYEGCPAILVADTEERLHAHVRAVLDNPLPVDVVREAAADYLDAALCGQDGRAAQRLAEWLLELSWLPSSERAPGWDDWLARIDASCAFSSQTMVAGAGARARGAIPAEENA